MKTSADIVSSSRYLILFQLLAILVLLKFLPLYIVVGIILLYMSLSILVPLVPEAIIHFIFIYPFVSYWDSFATSMFPSSPSSKIRVVPGA